MCATCGCSEPGHEHPHDHDHGHDHDHSPEHDHTHGPLHDPDGPPSTPITARPDRQARLLSLEIDLLAQNAARASTNRSWLAARGILALNLVSAPGSGKTTLLTTTIRALAPDLPMAVIEGDQETSRDAERILAAGARAFQINTGTGCHLDAAMVEAALAGLDPEPGSVLFVENVGNLVCPALFDLGEAAKVVLVSVTEGDDKPEKYPHMFRAASLLLVTKIDLARYVDFDVGRCIAHAQAANPGIEIMQVSATTGDGLGAWYDWLRERHRGARQGA